MEKNNKGFIGSILSYATPCKGKLLLSVIFAVCSVVGGMVPYVSAYRILEMFFSNTMNKEDVIKWGIICLCGFVIKIGFHTTSTILSHISAYSILEMMRKRIAEKLLKAPLGVTQGINAGKIKNLVVDQVENIEIPLAHIIPEGFAAIVLPVSVFIYLCMIDWRLALASLVTLPLALIPYSMMFSSYNTTYKKYMEANEYMNSVVIEYVEGIEVVKAFNQSTTSYQKYSHAVNAFKQTTIDWYKSTWKYTTLGASILPTTLLGVIPIGVALYLSGSATVANITMAMLLSMGLVSSFGRIVMFFHQVKSIQYSMETLNKTFDIEELPIADKEKKIEKYNISFENIDFSYDGNEKVINNVSLEIPEKSFYALVGPSGGGKSTLARLVARFWDVSSGTIKIGGIDIKDIPLTQLSDIVSFVTQDNFLFNCSIMENIRLGNPSASDEEVLIAARKAQCDEFINKLEDGYNTSAGEAGDKLSGGEKQRISIARAILKNSPIVILDEATSFTDPENESKIQEAIAELTKGKTLLVIAHRLSTITNADKIVIIKKGEIVQSGTHNELVESGGIYTDMWRSHIGAKNWSVKVKNGEALK